MSENSTRRRDYQGPAFLSIGFRPFFFAAALFAAIALPLWALYLAGYLPGPAALGDPTRWHAHEMIFGYTGAVLGGFLLTAIPNWTGRLPVRGWPLALLVMLWLCGRVAVALAALGIMSPLAAALVDLGYMTTLIALVLREIIAGRNWRNLPVVAILVIFDGANLISHLSPASTIDPRLGERLGLVSLATAITLIGGRIIPSFTRNWLMKEAGEPFPAPFGIADKLAILLTVLGLLFWCFFPYHLLTGILLALAGAAQALRLGRWQGKRSFAEPLVTILHVGYGWLVIALFALAAAIIAPAAIGLGAALHALTAGAISVMTLAVMTRATLGHTGRALTADSGTLAIYILVNIGALWRVAAPFMPFDYNNMAALAGLVWSCGFLIFAVKYGLYLLAPKADI
jgi:uncharacterized protein involved in response to NO